MVLTDQRAAIRGEVLAGLERVFGLPFPLALNSKAIDKITRAVERVAESGDKVAFNNAAEAELDRVFGSRRTWKALVR